MEFIHHATPQLKPKKINEQNIISVYDRNNQPMHLLNSSLILSIHCMHVLFYTYTVLVYRENVVNAKYPSIQV